MFDRLEIAQMAQALSRHAALRQNVVARNIANADTPGYVARDVADFSEIYRDTESMPMRATRKGHFGAGGMTEIAARNAATGHELPNGNGVSIEEEMVKAADIRRQNDLGLTIMKTTLGVLRSSLGRR